MESWRARMENPLKLKRIHHIEFWVGNARQAAYFYRKGFGFSQVAYSGLETGQRHRTSYAVSQGKANFILTTPFSEVAYSGLKTGQRRRTSYALRQGKANFMLTTPFPTDDLAANDVRKHGI